MTFIKRHKNWLLIPLLLATVLGGYLLGLQIFGNFHVVLPGELYRSAQLTPDQLRAFTQQFGIKSLLNLRGYTEGDAWYEAEKKTAADLGLSYRNFSMSDTAVLAQADAEKLIAIMKDAPKPLLIHCRAGADRSGLAAALYLAAIAQKGEKAAERQLSILYGHFSIPVLSKAYSMDVSFENLEEWLGLKGS